jgi:hypothetical protein
MSIKPLRQTQQVNIDYVSPYTQERGGCMTYAYASGMWFAQYSHEASGAVPIGIQLNDIEWMNLDYQLDRKHRSGIMTEMPCGIVGIGVEGEFQTDWLYIVGTVMPGDTAYVGPSGTFTNDASLGGIEIGLFLSTLTQDPHTVTMRGLGFSRQYIDCEKHLAWENNPADRVLVITPGFAKIRVKSTARLR